MVKINNDMEIKRFNEEKKYKRKIKLTIELTDGWEEYANLDAEEVIEEMLKGNDQFKIKIISDTGE
jgi:hypothetical protein